MKGHDLRNTVLIVTGTLIAAFVLGQWLVARQARALRDVHHQLATAQEQLALAKVKQDNALAEIEVMKAAIEEMQRLATKEPAKAPVGLLHRVKRGFNDIQHHVAKGEFQGLALTDGYMELEGILDHPAFEEMLASDHSTSGSK